MMRKHRAKPLGALVAIVAAIAMLAPAAQAATPAPGYENFAGCPSPKTENPAITSCLRSVITGGHFKMGNKTVPITNPIELSGGTDPEGEGFDYSPAGGLQPAKQKVPGGVVGLTGFDWLLDLLSVKELELYAVTELAGTPKVPNSENVTLPIKVHLENPILGKSCYVGSNSNPIVLNLTTGTTSPPPPNEPITGQAPEFTFDSILKILHGDNGIFVDNSFAAPGANGCTLNLGIIPVPINSVVNLASGLPAAAGTNETIQNYDLETVVAKRVYP
jgi:hypothetical protein